MVDEVWVTGVGVLTPLGADFDSVADALLAGRSAVARVDTFDVSQHPSQIASRVASIPVPIGADPDAFARLSRTDRAVRYCCTQALHDAGQWEVRAGLRAGLVLGGGGEWLPGWEDDRRAGQPLRAVEEFISSAESARTALGLAGPAVTVSTACASGNHALWLAREWLRQEWVDVCLAGACDLNCTPLTLAGFGNLRALSRRNVDPAGASRPFDRDRDGFVLGEGGAVFVLERATDARRRGTRAYAKLAGFGCTSDAYHLVAPCPEASQAAEASRRALHEAGASPEAVDYINAHGTGTSAGDLAECVALRAALGSAVETVPVSSTKSVTGHLLTAASAVEAVACLAAIARGAVPPTANLDHPDPACAVRHVPKHAEARRVRLALSNAFGFGGSNSCAAFAAV
jgi:3-oxoacyl-[acyl-carrier-protein] synthase II